jgi:hypothetical protein
MVKPNLPSRFKSAVRDALLYCILLGIFLLVFWIDIRFVDPFIHSEFTWLVRFPNIEMLTSWAATLVTVAAVPRARPQLRGLAATASECGPGAR